MAIINEIHGNIFATKCQVIVNTINCVGVMGAGIALECRYRHAEMFNRYKEYCDKGQMRPGVLFLWTQSEPWILNFPTKQSWKVDSTLAIIQSGLEKFAQTYRDKGIHSIAFPRLGTSHGGLSWSDVRKLMYLYLEPLHDLKIEIYSFDGAAADSLFDRLRDLTVGRTPENIARLFGIRSNQARSVAAALGDTRVGNMVALQQYKGIGVKTAEKIYEVLCSNSVVMPHERQMELF